MKKTSWLEMFPHEFHEEIKDNPICYMAYGPAEPHGVYSALGLDYLLADNVIHDAARTHGGIVAPPFAWHIQEQQYYNWEIDSCGMGMSLTSSIPEELFLHNMIHHIRNFDAKGFKAAILISGHFLCEMTKDMQMLADFYVRRSGSPMRITASQYDKYATERYFDDHAGLVESSMLMHYRPELIDLSLLEKPIAVPSSISGGNKEFAPYCAPLGFPLNYETGILPTPEIGAAMVKNIVDNLGKEKDKLLGSYQEKPGYKAPSVLDTEDIWNRFLKLAGRYLTITATRREAESFDFPEFPGWEELGE